MNIDLSNNLVYEFQGKELIVKEAFVYEGVSYDIIVSSDVDLSEKSVFPNIAEKVAFAWKNALQELDTVSDLSNIQLHVFENRAEVTHLNQRIKQLSLGIFQKLSDLKWNFEMTVYCSNSNKIN